MVAVLPIVVFKTAGVFIDFFVAFCYGGVRLGFHIFRSGTRKNEQMQPIVEQIDNEDIRNLGAYFASLTPPKAPPDDNPDLSQKGAQAAVGRRCASCHTDSFAGTKAVARIAGQREEYLLKALRDYKSGVRSGGGMAAMADVAYPLSEEEITALAHYLAHL